MVVPTNGTRNSIAHVGLAAAIGRRSLAPQTSAITHLKYSTQHFVGRVGGTTPVGNSHRANVHAAWQGKIRYIRIRVHGKLVIKRLLLYKWKHRNMPARLRVAPVIARDRQNRFV